MNPNTRLNGFDRDLAYNAYITLTNKLKVSPLRFFTTQYSRAERVFAMEKLGFTVFSEFQACEYEIDEVRIPSYDIDTIMETEHIIRQETRALRLNGVMKVIRHFSLPNLRNPTHDPDVFYNETQRDVAIIFAIGVLLQDRANTNRSERVQIIRKGDMESLGDLFHQKIGQVLHDRALEHTLFKGSEEMKEKDLTEADVDRLIGKYIDRAVFGKDGGDSKKEETPKTGLEAYEW